MKTCLVFTLALWYQSPDLWLSFEKVAFESRFVEAEQTAFYFPVFTDELRELSGKKVRVSGYYLPIDYGRDAIVLSRYPMATCFFCGEAGPESVMMVYPSEALKNMKVDEKVSFEGVLELNGDDIYQLSFILREAKRL